jgi:SAM-dependent methyltransferase
VVPDSPDAYWNHNTAFHSEILRRCDETVGDVLDIGCGDGLLVSRMAGTGRHVFGIEPDPQAAEQARRRCAGLTNVTVIERTFDEASLDDSSFGFVALVATLHHMDTSAALRRCVRLLCPGGRLYVLGLTRIASRTDLAFAVASIPRARTVGALRNEQWPDDVPTIEPSETLTDIRDRARLLLPGARLRRRAYYRYSLEWTKPWASRDEVSF